MAKAKLLEEVIISISCQILSSLTARVGPAEYMRVDSSMWTTPCIYYSCRETCALVCKRLERREELNMQEGK